VVLARAGHPVLTERPTLKCLSQLDYVVVRQHAETVKLLDAMQLQHNVRLSTPHFLVIPAILSQTDLAVLLPLRIASKFARAGQFCVGHPRWGVSDFVVGLHWSHRAQNDPAHRWLRDIALSLFREPAPNPSQAPRPEH
jgi:DNA-binding transcriptional LysR family regulator